MPPRYQVFLSHSSADKPAVEKIARKLREAGIEPFLDKWHLVPGDPWQEALEKALDQSSTCAVFVGPGKLGPWHHEEMRTALDERTRNNSFRVIPVLLPGAQQPEKKDLRRFINRLTWVDFRLGVEDADALHRLVSGIKGTPPGPGGEADADAAKATLNSLPINEVPPPGPLPEGSRMPLPHNPLFVGREEDLKTLARQLKAGETSAVGQVEIAAATGLGGIGKTQVASEFVHRYGRFFTGGVFWISFADASAVSAEVAACGRSLGLHSSFDALPLEQQIHLVEQEWRSQCPRLLVFDNCEEEELLHRWRPPSGKTRVLVTSRRAEWDPILDVKTVPLTILPRSASIELLRRFRPDVPETEPALDAIAGELGDLPLALHLAGGFLKTYRDSSYGQPTAYLETLRQTVLLEHPSLQGRGTGLSPTGHDGHVGRTFTLSLERLDPASHIDTLALDFLARAAWFAPGEPIPRSLLLKTVQTYSGDLTTGLLAQDALHRLIDLGLVEANDRRELLIHRLVATWARGGTKRDRDEAQQAVETALLEEASQLNEIGDPARLLLLLPHLRMVTDQALRRHDQIAAQLCNELGTHLWHGCDYPGAQPYLEKAAALHAEVSGTEHPDTAKSLRNLGRLFHSQGDYLAARSCYEQSLAIQEKILGPEHPETAHSLNDLGDLLRVQGNFEGASHYSQRALEIRRKVLGPEHPETAASLNNLGSLLRDGGDFDGARVYYERALEIQEKVLGPEHSDTATSLNNLGVLLRIRGDFSGARPHYERALEIQEKVLGPEHPDTATSLNNFGTLLQYQGDFRGARPYCERALAIRKKVLGPEHPNTARSLLNLASIDFNQGELKRARSYLEQAILIFEARLGPDHPTTKDIHQRLGKLREAC